MAASQEDRLNSLKQKYQPVFRVIEQQQVRLDHVHLQDNKLFISGVAPSTEAKNKVWDQIKLVDSTYSDLTADITVQESARPQTAGAAAGGGQREFQTYTVQPGDTLSKISQKFYGNPGQYTKIFEANRDKLIDPNKIFPGQTLTIP